jgi:hypothetical protein
MGELMGFEPTCLSGERMSRTEACVFIARALRLSYATVSRRTIYAPDFAGARTGERFFDRALVVDAVNRRLG